MATYDPHELEPRWQAFWAEHDCFRTLDDHSLPKYYVLDMFPYPSGAGLHVGHPEGYTATDILARYHRMKGFNVLHPMGWDAFGLPAERAALREGEHPAKLTAKYIANFRRQIQRLGFSYDWSREIDTTDPGYYRWTQWIFLRLHERGLAYQAEVMVNWCPAQGTVLANEEVQDGKYVETGDPVERRPLRQWMLKIPEYAERLLADLEDLDWPEPIKEMQRHWIGRSEGARIRFALQQEPATDIEVFTTRPDTLYGATYLVLAPEHALVAGLTTGAQRAEVDAYVKAAGQKTTLFRTELSKEKTGVFTGAYALHPVTGEALPVWIADYVITGYGTGAIMAVPGHDERDWAFARAMGLPVVEVIEGGNLEEGAFTGDGPHVNSGILDGQMNAQAKRTMIAWLEENGRGRQEITFRLRDWLFSRQRYWGEPFPVVHHADGRVEVLPEHMLPVELPHLDDIRPTEDGQPPLARAGDWRHTVSPTTGEPVLRETNTMPQWAGSCWYYLRFIDPHNPGAPVDLYVGGAEHAVLHLLYARFWHKVLYDCGVVSTKEPFQRLFNQGMILAFSYRTKDGKYLRRSQVEEREGGQTVVRRTRILNAAGEEEMTWWGPIAPSKETLAEDGFQGLQAEIDEVEVSVQVEKMSKSKFNVANPDEVIAEYGADTLRLYEMYLGPLEATKPWQPDGIRGMYRFLARAWRLLGGSEDQPARPVVDHAPDEAMTRLLHTTIRRVTEDLDGMRFNTAIAALIECLNELMKAPELPREAAETFALLLSPFAPHLGEELWAMLGHTTTLSRHPWPTWDPAVLVARSATIAVQVLGRTRGTLEVPVDIAEADAVALALADPRIAAHVGDRPLRRTIWVPGKILNLIV
jgi:leucyl-tRNA synthetase